MIGSLCARRWRGVIDMPGRHQMIDGVTVQKQIVSDDSAMTPPPNRFRAHQGKSLVLTKTNELIERRAKLIAQGIVGVVVEALNPPHRIELFINAGLFRPSTAQRGTMPISDLNLFKVSRQPIDVEEGIAPRPWECSDIDQQIDTRLAQHV